MNIIKHCSLAFLFSASVCSTTSATTVPAASNHHSNQTWTVQQAIAEEKNINNIYRAYFPDEEVGRKAVISFHSQLHEANFEEGYLILELTSEELEKLRIFDFKFKPANDFIKNRNIRLNKIQQRLQSENVNQVAAIPGYACYETVEETFAEAERIVRENSNLAEFIDVGNSWEKTQGIGGYDIKVLVLTNKSTIGDKPKLFINSAIHARE